MGSLPRSRRTDLNVRKRTGLNWRGYDDETSTMTHDTATIPKPLSATDTAELFLEIGVEEMPPNVIADTLRQWQAAVGRQFETAGIAVERIVVYGTPRRLILHLPSVSTTQTPRIERIVGPPKRAAFDAAGAPTAAAVGFAKSQGVAMADLQTQTTDRGEYLTVEKKTVGRPTAACLPEILPATLATLSFPKSMRWNASRVAFVRPIRWIVALYDGAIVPFEYAGVASGDISYGVRTMTPSTFRVTDFNSYQTEMMRRHVVIDPQARYNRIAAEITALAEEAGGIVSPDDDLLWQAAWVTESPKAILGAFDPSFLTLPPAVITAVMKEHQGCFPLHAPVGGLLPAFITITNVQAKEMDMIRRGNERVLRARLIDAQFYDDQDRKMKLADRVEALRRVTFQEKLGTLHDKIDRVSALCLTWAQILPGARPEVLRRAALLYKCDLLTGVVREFPSLEGAIGRIYALRDGEPPDVAAAIESHYRPRFSGDALPTDFAGGILSVADKLDTIVGCFGAGLIPSGSEDPYALRRQGMGLVQILAHDAFRALRLTEAIAAAAAGYERQGKFSDAGILVAVGEFFKGRMASWLQDRGIRYDLVDAVLAQRFDCPCDTLRRVDALASAARQPHFEALLTGVKRASRILPAGFAGAVNPDLFKEEAETELYRSVAAAEAQVGDAAIVNDQNRDDGAILQQLAGLAEPLDRFFARVMVMVPDEAIRNNRLALLLRVRTLSSAIADFSKIQGGG